MRIFQWFATLMLAAAIYNSSALLAPEALSGAKRIIATFDDALVDDGIIATHLTWLESMGLPVVYVHNIGSFSGYTLDVGAVDDTVVAWVIERIMDTGIIRCVEPDIVGTIQSPWGLGRISHETIDAPGDYLTYVHDPQGGKDAVVFVIDTGVYVEHDEFAITLFGHVLARRASWGANYVTSEEAEDLHGHGTHCSGTIAGKTYGVAQSAQIVAVKVCDKHGQCQASDVIAGIEFAVQQHMNLTSTKRNYRGAVISMSLGFEPAEKVIALTLAADAAVTMGVAFAVAAGNSNDSACKTSPAAARLPLTVGAVDYTDTRASFSNFGPCVNVFAPGVRVLSAFNSGPTSRELASGTSMATPHVAGLLAYYASLHTFDSVTDLQKYVEETSLFGYIHDPKDSPNRLVNNLHADFDSRAPLAHPVPATTFHSCEE